MAIKEFKYKVSSTENAEIIVEYAKKDRLGNQIDTTYAKKGEIPSGAVTTTDTLTANKIVLGNGNKTVKTSTYGISGTWSAGSDTTVPTMKAVETKISGLGGGTVTKVETGDGLTGGPITGSGTVAVDSTVVRTTGAQTIADAKSFTGVVTLKGSTSHLYFNTTDSTIPSFEIKANSNRQPIITMLSVNGTSNTLTFPIRTDTVVTSSDIANFLTKNTAITGATKCKITYDSKGLVTSGADLAATDIPSLAASKITSGTFDTARIPDLGAGKITSGTFSADRIPTLAQSKITDLTTDLAAKEASSNKEATVSTSTTKFPTSKAVRDFVNSSIEANAARYITSNSAGDAFPTKQSLTDATKFYYAGLEVTLTRNDYCVVLADESKQEGEFDPPTTRYLYTVNGSGTGSWSFQYVVNNNPFTYAQMEAINSGATGGFVNDLTSHYGDKSNPHGVTQTQVGLGNVVNTGDSATPVQNGTTKFTTGGAYALKTSLEGALSTKQTAFTDGSATVASKSGNVVTLKAGVSQSGGKIANSTGTDITLAAVASTGSYDDLSNKPTIPTSFDLTDNILDGGPNTYAPYPGSTATSTWVGTDANAGKLYSGTVAPSKTTRLNYNGALYATSLTSSTDVYGQSMWASSGFISQSGNLGYKLSSSGLSRWVSGTIGATVTLGNSGTIAVTTDITAANCGFVLTDYTIPTS